MGLLTVRLSHLHRPSGVMAILVLTLSASVTRVGATSYCVTDIGTLGGATSRAYAINARGDIVGSSTLAGDTRVHAFLYKARQQRLIDLDPQRSDRNSRAWAINGRGRVAGDVSAGGTALHPALFRRGQVIDPGLVPALDASAVGINDAGDVLIDSWNPPVPQHQGYLLHHGHVVALPIAFVSGINDHHQVVGALGLPPFLQAVSYGRGVLTPVGGSLAAQETNARAVNARGDVTGGFLGSDGLTGRSFLDRGGVATDLGTLPGGLVAAALALNAHDQVVGYAFDYSTTFVERAFLYDARLDPPMQDLNDLIPTDSTIVLNRATGINDDGIIVGYGTIGGEFHAFALSPNPS